MAEEDLFARFKKEKWAVVEEITTQKWSETLTLRSAPGQPISTAFPGCQSATKRSAGQARSHARLAQSRRLAISACMSGSVCGSPLMDTITFSTTPPLNGSGER